MKRWLVVAIVVLVPLLALESLRWRSTPEGLAPSTPMDEVLAYEVTPEAPLLLRLPAGFEQVHITTWVFVSEPPDIEARYPYAYAVQLSDPNRGVIAAHTFETESRISRVASHGTSAASYNARLGDEDGWVSDGRTANFASPAVARGGVVRIDVRAGSYDRVFVRAVYGEPRDALARGVVEETLGIDGRRRLVAGRSALGFRDIGVEARATSIARWGRRLDAVGREHVDYQLRRLLLGSLRTTWPWATRSRRGFEVGERRALAMNFGRPATLHLTAPPNHALRMGGGAPNDPVYDTGPAGEIELALPAVSPHTLVIRGVSGADFAVHMAVAPGEATAQIGGPGATLGPNGLAEILPDVRLLRLAQLDPTVPVVARLAPGQKLLGVSVTGCIDAADPRPNASGALEARWRLPNGTARHASVNVDLPRSSFERFRVQGGRSANPAPPERDGTSMGSLSLALPPGVERVELFGDPGFYVGLFTLHPDVATDLLEFPYRVTLAEAEFFRFAPYELRARTTIAPENHDDLERAGRIQLLATQVRIEHSAERADRPERVLIADGTPIEHRYFESTTLAAGAPLPPDGLSVLDDKRLVEVVATGPRARRLRLLYRLPPAQLATTLKFFVDGKERAEQTAMLLSGTMDAEVEPGAHSLDLSGLGDGRAYVDAAPKGGGSIVRQRTVYRMGRGEDVVYRISQRTGEHLTLVLFVTSEVPALDWTASFAIDGGSPRLHDAFFRFATTARGTLSGRTGNAGRGLLWEAEEPARAAFPHGLSKVKLILGDDLVGGTHVVRFTLLEPAANVWVRAVLVGQPEAARGPDTRLWAEEIP